MIFLLQTNFKPRSRSIYRRKTLLQEAAQEKKRSDYLLYQMLPKDVATALKNRQSVEAQYYDDVTVYFSDIVGFTDISSKSSPIQVMNNPL